MKQKGKFNTLILLFVLLFKFTFLFSDDHHPNIYLSLNQTNTSNKSGFHSGLFSSKRSQVNYYRYVNLGNLSSNQLKEYCEQYKYSEKEIFANPCFFMSDEFVKYAKTLPGYKEKITNLYKKIRTKTGLSKAVGWIGGSYEWGLQGRIKNLYKEVQWCLNKSTQHKSILQLKNIENDVIDFARLYKTTKQQLTHKFTDQSEYNCHKKFVDHLLQASELTDIYKQLPDCQFFLDAVGYGASIGIEANIYHQKETVSKWLIFCNEALEIAKGIAEGIKDGIYNTGIFVTNLVQHPIETVQHLCYSIGSLLVIVAKVVGIKLKIDFLTITGDYPGLLRYTQELNEQCASIIKTCAAKLATISNRDIARHSTAFAVELYLVGKTFDCGFKLFSQIKPLLNSTVESLKTELAIEYAVATAEGSIINFREKATQIGSAAKQIIKTCRPTLEVFREQFMQKLAPQIVKLQSTFGGKLKGFAEFKNKFIKFSFEHIFGIHLKHNKNGISRLGGWHLDYLQEVEKSGIIEFLNKTILENGVYRADLVYNGKIIKRGATFFPSNLTWEQVMRIFYEAYKNFLSKGAQFEILPNGNYIAKGIAKKTMEIEMIFTQKGCLKTIYPIVARVIKK
jgi:hypothetical protein